MFQCKPIILALLFFMATSLTAAPASEPKGLKEINKESLEVDLVAQIHESIITKHPTVIRDEIEVRIENIEKAKEKLPKIARFYKLIIGRDTALLDRAVLRVYYYDENKNFRSQYSIFVRIRAFSNYVFSTKPILQKTIITEKDLITRKEDIYNKPKNVLASKDYIIGKEAAYTIGENNLILDWMVGTIPLVKQGDTLDVHYTKNNIKLETKGISLEEGGIRDKIRVQLKTTKKILLGEIIATDTVKIIINP